MSDITLHATEQELRAVRARLQAARGKQFWRSLDELADTPAFQELLRREFPAGAAELSADPVTRRTFLKLMGASLALAGLSGCTFAIKQPQELVAPFARAPHNQEPGIPLYYATATSFEGFGLGVAVKNYDGRPIKIEGNPNHPASLGATDLFAQAEILQLYDPDRPETVLNTGRISTWEQFLLAFGQVMQLQRGLQGQGLRVLTPTITSPTLAAQFEELLATFPGAKWVQYDPVGRSNTYEGARLAFGEVVETRYRLDRARVIVSLDSDVLQDPAARARYARDWISRRRVLKDTTEISRLYAIEPVFSNTGVVADHRLRLKASEVGAAAAYIAAGLGVPNAPRASLPEEARPFLDALIADLRAAGSEGVVVVGEWQPPVVHALAHAINAALGAVGVTVEHTDAVAARPGDQVAALRDLVNDLNAGAVEVLVIIDSNPAFTAPADLNFADAMSKAKFKAALNFYNDETAALADWFIPLCHTLESWSDIRAYDGTATIIQPLILPLYGGRTAHELLAVMLGQSGQTPYDLVRAYWQQQSGFEGTEFDNFFRGSLNNGVVPGTALPARTVTPRADVTYNLPPASEGLELIFRPDPAIWDGRYANNGWLQELPRPMTKLTWDNAALVSPGTAIRLLNLPFTLEDLASPDNAASQWALERLSRANGTLIELRHQGRALTMPIWIVPGHAENTITVTLGYGRGEEAGRVAANTGFNTYALRTSEAPWFSGQVEVSVPGGTYPLVSTQDHWTLQGRDIVRAGEFERFKADPKHISREVYLEEYGKDTPGPGTEGYVSLLPGNLPGFDYSVGNQWGMTIDLTACIGCNACVVACQAENNIPIVGKSEVARGREMHWIRIDRYFAGSNFDNPETYMMPMTCQHCEQAPCELVCPVAATVHDAEGLNNMVYNRCVGTKYCSNNCPYKVRRFNFFQYQDLETPSLKLMRNPEVTVRNRGVMEKCSYCIQRIVDVRTKAKVQGNRPIEDGEVVTACQQACPTQAIIFGDINNPESKVTKYKAQPHNYTVLGLLNTLPRTSYLARVWNPNPALAPEHGEE
ncbi:MAG: TAT-variant-translocated molybdopterin oxidoreductase [Chloroflexaceae bacterium]|nr:TAT-variant-translocated molybdopterin oxidoreductase [Chloroflexaceae bacterium]